MNLFCIGCRLCFQSDAIAENTFSDTVCAQDIDLRWEEKGPPNKIYIYILNQVK